MTVHIVHSALDAINRLMDESYQLVIIDLALHDNSSLKLIQTMRRMTDIPIMAVSQCGDMENKEKAYNMGADDFIDKPINMRECLLRAKSCVRRYKNIASSLNYQKNTNMSIVEGNLLLDPLTCYVCCNGEEIRLSKQEFDLLYYLASYPGRTLTHSQLRSYVWKDDITTAESNALPTAISRLRKKLKGTNCIKTVRNLGYCFYFS